MDSLFTNYCNYLPHMFVMRRFLFLVICGTVVYIIVLIMWLINCWANLLLLKVKKQCVVCLRSKKTWDSVPLSLNRATIIFYFIHCNSWVPYNTSSTSRALYFLIILHDHSRSMWIYLLAEKRDALLVWYKASLIRMLKL